MRFFSRASPQLAWFMMYTSLCVLGFVLTFSLMFGAHSYNYSSLKPSMYSCYLLLLGVFDWADFIRTDPVGPIMFMVFCIVMTMVLINIFMTILMEVYAEVCSFLPLLILMRYCGDNHFQIGLTVCLSVNHTFFPR